MIPPAALAHRRRGCSAWSPWASRCGSVCGSRRRTSSRGTWPGCSTSTPPSPRWRCTGSGWWPPVGACSTSGRARARSSGTGSPRPSVEVGAVFAALTLVTGSLWGRPVWGVWWTWDARLTSTALLLLLEIGYLALRRVPAEPAIRARRCAVAALLIAIDIPIVHFSVDWWNTLHQGGTFIDPGLPDPRLAIHVVDLPARLRRLLAALRLAPRRALPGGGAAGRGGRPGARGVAERALERGHRARRLPAPAPPTPSPGGGAP